MNKNLNDVLDDLNVDLARLTTLVDCMERVGLTAQYKELGEMAIDMIYFQRIVIKEMEDKIHRYFHSEEQEASNDNA